jgi:hypothetical protein
MIQFLTENNDHQTYRHQSWKRMDKQVYLDESQLKCSLKVAILLPEKKEKEVSMKTTPATQTVAIIYEVCSKTVTTEHVFLAQSISKNTQFLSL